VCRSKRLLYVADVVRSDWRLSQSRRQQKTAILLPRSPSEYVVTTSLNQSINQSIINVVVPSLLQ